MILTLTLFLFSSFFLFEKGGKMLIRKIEEKADFSVYFKTEIPEEEILKMKDGLLKFQEVEKVKYVSREEALLAFKERHKENPTLMEALREVGNPFLASLNIRLRDPNEFEKISDFFKRKEEMVEKIDFFQRKPLIEKIFSLSTYFKKTMTVLILIFLFVSFLVVFATLHLSISNYREEIFTQRLVGASNFTISFPFLFQGIVAGIIAAIISTILINVVFFFLSPKLEILFPEIKVYDLLRENLILLFFYQALLGSSWGFLSSFLATKKYLKE
jgi:cell division transport system permease protein